MEQPSNQGWFLTRKGNIHMICFVHRFLYFQGKRKNNLLLYRIAKLFLNLVYPLYSLVIKPKTGKPTSKGVLVSMTSFPQRIKSVQYAVETIFRQNLKPEKFILWLSDSQFKSIEELPRGLKKQIGRGLQIRFFNEIGIRPHNKYFHTMGEFSHYKVITVDDDTFYPENLVETLVATSEKFPNTVCCTSGTGIEAQEGKVLPIVEWDHLAQNYEKPSHVLFPIGAQGVLYPPGILHGDLLDSEKIKRLCPTDDDIWLKAMSSLNHVMAVKTRNEAIYFPNLFSYRKEALFKINIKTNKSQEQLDGMLKEYPELNKIWSSQ